MALPEPKPAGHTIRRLRASDRAQILAYFLRLDPETRANRFMGSVGEAGIRAYAERAVTADGLIFGAFVSGTLRGVAELRPSGPGATPLDLGRQAEAAFAVERAYRRRGIGGALFTRITEAARNRGVGDLHVRCLAMNGPMRRLAIRHGADLQASGTEAEAAVHLERPTPFSLWHESIAEAFDLTIAALQSRNPPPA
ncbi:GNAT family N-acetyltransferase [Methylobacterium sp. WL30]|uniref:GNAT family N-acetyltransferase n=1 Tax=unclassified Methylobacterium TaxID=2615210 RepID=UPI0011C7596F|nr:MULTISPECIES: GNAT family N-acetyltransferase [unclassified Methylobacterium]TXM93599.1 GNAT family N-acetyltransferase [Methylobacterium sp. WL116]TXN41622.1 GNAT family N-acetyltransferase [Methylobacterium sp. WL93]TXN52857.1 GNAT family N-acetyltransferase [Methylobacterium sp. WL119]TXN70530.1 GNAT family N-acetyltransferase [Methylobacterium sp. WL30]